MIDRFETGKQYVNLITGTLIKVLFVGENVAFCKCVKQGTGYAKVGDEFVQNFRAFYNYDEYTPPKVETFTRYIARCKASNDGFATVKVDDFGNIIGGVEFTVIDGKLTKVEIVK